MTACSERYTDGIERRGAAGCAGRWVQLRRWVLAVLCAAVLACLVGAAGYARADEASGYFTVQGLGNVDETVQYATLSDAFGAVSGGDGGTASILVHGTVALDGTTSWEAQGSTCALVGADGEARIVVGSEGGALAFSNPAGSLVVRGIAFSGGVELSASGSLAVESCTFDGGVTCAAGESVAVSGNSFTSASGGGCALSVSFAEGAGALSFTGNQVSGYTCGVKVECLGTAQPSVSVTSNSFALADDGSGIRPAALRLAGGPWPTSSVACDRNSVAGASALVALDATFSMLGEDQWDAQAQSVSDGSLLAGSVVSLFELVLGDVAGLAPETSPVCVDAEFDGTVAAEQVASASVALRPDAGSPVPAQAVSEGATSQPATGQQAAPAEDSVATVTVSYDSNGAGGGQPPASVTVSLGSSVTVETMGTLVRAGFVFEGWNTQADGMGTFYAAGQVFAPQGDMVLYAQWAPTGTVATVDVSAAQIEPTQTTGNDGAGA